MPRGLPMAAQSLRRSSADPPAIAQLSTAVAHRRYRRTAAGWRPRSSPMLFAFAIFEKRLDIIVVQARPVTHANGLDLQGPAPGPVIETQRRAQQIIQSVAEGGSPGPALALYPVHN